MSHFPLPLAGALLALGLAVTACERREEIVVRDVEQKVPPTAVPQPAPAAPAFDDDEVQEDLADAREEFLERDFDDSADELREAAEKVRRVAANAPAEVREDLIRSAQELEGLAGDVRSGAITSVDEFDRSLVSTNATLARHHLHRAREAWAQRDLRAAGRDLAAAARSVEHGLANLGRRAEGEGAAAIRDVRELGGTLARGAEAAPEDVERALQRLEQEIETFVQEARNPRR